MIVLHELKESIIKQAHPIDGSRTFRAKQDDGRPGSCPWLLQARCVVWTRAFLLLASVSLLVKNSGVTPEGAFEAQG